VHEITEEVIAFQYIQKVTTDSIGLLDVPSRRIGLQQMRTNFISLLSELDTRCVLIMISALGYVKAINMIGRYCFLGNDQS
jgi:hypothetical protein